ncbi:hypothetical protein [Pseudonocardia lacus]|uniref:hypothetical protein n=1 Tax=Pseudonocardia lacus TaxID=2835865 RepID=UPI001BDD4E1E|nr:hypothetical protein [Pseudonocardia lacus]
MLFGMALLSGSTASGWAFWTTPGDPTGLSSPLGRIVVLVGLLAALVVTLRWWWTNRRR